VPKYYYHCHVCHSNFYVHHMISETQELCTLCGESEISKLLTKPLYVTKSNTIQKTGDLTKKYINDNKKVLDDLKKEAKSKTYE
jgi:putative FmdB family regulatory protein